MSVVVTFLDYQPVPRYDDLPWTEARIEESDASDGTYAEIETITLDPVDADPSAPAYRNLTTELGTAADMWYRIVFVDGTGDESAPTTPVQNVSQTSRYATATELGRILKITNPTAAQTAAMNRVLLTAAGEIDSEIDREEGDEISGWQLALAEEVNLERAVELWRATPFGILGIDSDIGATHISRNTWERYALMLAPLKGQWGIA